MRFRQRLTQSPIAQTVPPLDLEPLAGLDFKLGFASFVWTFRQLAIDATKAYDKAAFKLRGNKAILNFPIEIESSEEAGEMETRVATRVINEMKLKKKIKEIRKIVSGQQTSYEWGPFEAIKRTLSWAYMMHWHLCWFKLELDYIYKITCEYIYESYVITYVGRMSAFRRQKIDLRQNGISGLDLFLRSQIQ
ncbi:hypothetical protein LXL04_005663 [Taraxacum kok-saghyz]